MTAFQTFKQKRDARMLVAFETGMRVADIATYYEVSIDTVQRLVRGRPRQRGQAHRAPERALQAAALRAQGKQYKQIAFEMGIQVSTVGSMLRSLQLTRGTRGLG